MRISLAAWLPAALEVLLELRLIGYHIEDAEIDRLIMEAVEVEA